MLVHTNNMLFPNLGSSKIFKLLNLYSYSPSYSFNLAQESTENVKFSKQNKAVVYYIVTFTLSHTGYTKLGSLRCWVS